MSDKLRIPGLLLIFAVFSACEGERADSPHRIRDVWARPMAVQPVEEGGFSGGNSAVYLKIQNTGGMLDHLLGGETPVARGVEVHESTLEGDIVRMRRVERLELPPGDVVELRPGGLHLMLVGLRHSLAPGDTFPLTLTFQEASPSILRVPVLAGGEG